MAGGHHGPCSLSTCLQGHSEVALHVVRDSGNSAMHGPLELYTVPGAAPEVGGLKGTAWSWLEPEGSPHAQARPEPVTGWEGQ